MNTSYYLDRFIAVVDAFALLCFIDKGDAQSGDQPIKIKSFSVTSMQRIFYHVSPIENTNF